MSTVRRVLVAASLAGLLPAQEPPPSPRTAAAELFAGQPRGRIGGKYAARQDGRVTMAARGGRFTAAAIGAGLDWLAAHQDADGKWNADDFMVHDRGTPCDGAGLAIVDVPVTAYALLAFLQDGSHPGGGPHRETVRRGILWLTEQQDEDSGLIGLPAHPRFLQHHAAATLALLEAYVHSGYEGLRPAAQRALDFLEHERDDGGGWSLHTGDRGDDLVVTTWGILAHVVGKDAALRIDDRALPQAAAALRKNAGTDADDLSLRSSAARLFGRFLAKPERNDEVRRLADACLAQQPTDWSSTDAMSWFTATRAQYQMAENRWPLWSKRVLPRCRDGQRTDDNYAGSWDPDSRGGRTGGRVYATALGVLTLESYYAYTRLAR